MPGLDLTQIYQLWVIQPGKPPSSMGTFAVDPNGMGTLMVPASSAPEPPQTLAVTRERAGGVTSPVGPMVLMGSGK